MRAPALSLWLVLVALAAALGAIVHAHSAGADRKAGPVEQPYLQAIELPEDLGRLAPVKVAVVDSGIDGAHPDLAGRIAAARSFGGGDPLFPSSPHGTAVAGLIAAVRGNGVGIEGIAPNAQLVAVDISTGKDGNTFDSAALDAGIRWAVDQGARVVNLSLGGFRADAIEQDAIGYALRKGALVVAAAGNCFDEQGCPTPAGTIWAPAWLPHVVAVGAVDASSTAAARFTIPSGRWIDLAAPGELVTTLWPTRNNPYSAPADCAFVGTTACYWTGGTPNRRWGPSGTSYSAPMVSAAAAILFGADPTLTPAQVARLLEETARPLAAVRGRDPRIGRGVLDVAAALQRVRAGTLPPRDRGEPNEEPSAATPLPPRGSLEATIDWSDDPSDLYGVRLRTGERLVLRTRGDVAATVRLAPAATPARALASSPLGRVLEARVPRAGRYLVTVVPARGASGRYVLSRG